MSLSKKIFIAISTVFFAGLVLVSYDIGRKTTFPGSKGQLKERIEKTYINNDTGKAYPPDSLK